MRKYPLEPLVDLREKKVDEAATALANAAAQREAAASALQMAEARRDAQAKMAQSIRDAEIAALSAGRLRAFDLACTDAWGVRVATERAALGAAVQRAAAAEAKAIQSEAESAAAVVARRAEAKVVAEHRAGWDRARLRAIESREEEDSQEAWRSRG